MLFKLGRLRAIWRRSARFAAGLLEGEGVDLTPENPAESWDESTFDPGARRGVARRDTEAKQWFAWHGLAATAVDLQLFTDELASRNLRVARLWHTTCSLRSVSGRRNLLVMVQLEGTTRISFGDSGVTETFEPGDIVIIPAGTHCRMDSHDQVARMEIEIVSSALPKAVAEAFVDGAVFPNAAPALRSVLTATVHTALNSEIDPMDPSFPTFSLAIGHLTAGVLIEATAKPATVRVLRSEYLFKQAVGIIAQRASDVDFTVATLAHELQVSERYLRKIFTSHDTNAQKEIRAARTALARQYLAPGGPRVTQVEAARMAGFGHPQTMRSALRETRG